mmetsp:Transcript_2820/g.4643  ORF Transcript_2820/g.4643 Transcript_2820/m.4643 type:complete len:208 (-) Transcript_2820:550-1173(-)
MFFPLNHFLLKGRVDKVFYAPDGNVFGEVTLGIECFREELGDVGLFGDDVGIVACLCFRFVVGSGGSFTTTTAVGGGRSRIGFTVVPLLGGYLNIPFLPQLTSIRKPLFIHRRNLLLAIIHISITAIVPIVGLDLNGGKVHRLLFGGVVVLKGGEESPPFFGGGGFEGGADVTVPDEAGGGAIIIIIIIIVHILSRWWRGSCWWSLT